MPVPDDGRLLSTLTQKEVDLHVALRIGVSTVVEVPWPHIVIRDTLPKSTHEALLEAARTFDFGRAVQGRRYRIVDASFSPAVAAFESELVLDALEHKLGFRGFPRPRLVHDVKGYEYPIHPDIPEKAGTLQLYLTDEYVDGYGTRLHEGPSSPSFVEVPYLPNLAYAFKKTDRSFHSTGRICGAKPRRSLLIPYMTERLSR